MSGVSDRANQLKAAIPYLRRYARALTGTRASGDHYAYAALQSILDDDSPSDNVSGCLELFRSFHQIWSSTGQPVDGLDADNELEARALQKIAGLTPDTREVLLLHTVEDMSINDISYVIGASARDTNRLLDIAYDEMSQRNSGRILIIEDETLIALELESIVSEMGHVVTGVAITKDKAMELAEREDFDLILSDIKLADGSDGSEAVKEIFASQRETPVIYITAYPEKLLTGEGWEPAFLISKPYEKQQVRTAVSQALFFASTASLIDATAVQ